MKLHILTALALTALPLAGAVQIPEGGVTVPMGDFGGRPLVDVRIDGKGPYRFILDTGADETVMDEGLALELNLQTGMYGRVSIGRLSIGEATLTDTAVTSVPLAGMLGKDGPRGVLSAASFPGFLLVLDYPAKRITIHKGALPPADGRTRFEYTAEQVLPNVPLRVAGVEVRAHIDTGAPGSVTLPTKYMRELPLEGEPLQAGHARTPAGEFPVYIATLKGTVDLGKYTLEVTRLAFSDVNPVPGPPVGNLGYKILSTFVITMDSANRRIQLDR